MELSTYGLSVLLLVQVTGVHPDTARRWKRTGKVPKKHATQVALATEGDLGVVAPEWSGFRLKSGMLWTPEGKPIRPGDVLAIPYRAQQILALEAEVRAARTPKQSVPRCHTATIAALRTAHNTAHRARRTAKTVTQGMNEIEIEIEQD
jgi:hypothetical protein